MAGPASNTIIPSGVGQPLHCCPLPHPCQCLSQGGPRPPTQPLLPVIKQAVFLVAFLFSLWLLLFPDTSDE